MTFSRPAGYVPAAAVTDQDVRSAQAALDAILGELALGLSQTDQGFVRGLLAGWSADVREAGYVEGVAAGRVEGSRWAGRIVRDALEGEGL